MKRDSLKRNIFFSLVLLTSACSAPSFHLYADEINNPVFDEKNNPVFVKDGFDESEKAFIQETYNRIQAIAAEVDVIAKGIEKPNGWGITKIIQFLDKKIKEINETILQPFKQIVIARSKRSSSTDIYKALHITSEIAQELHNILKQLHSTVSAQKNKGHLLMGMTLKQFLVSVSKNNIPKLERQLIELQSKLQVIPDTLDLQNGMKVIITELHVLKKKIDEPSDTAKVLALIKQILSRG